MQRTLIAFGALGLGLLASCDADLRRSSGCFAAAQDACQAICAAQEDQCTEDLNTACVESAKDATDQEKFSQAVGECADALEQIPDGCGRAIPSVCSGVLDSSKLANWRAGAVSKLPPGAGGTRPGDAGLAGIKPIASSTGGSTGRAGNTGLGGYQTLPISTGGLTGRAGNTGLSGNRTVSTGGVTGRAGATGLGGTGALGGVRTTPLPTAG